LSTLSALTAWKTAGDFPGSGFADGDDGPIEGVLSMCNALSLMVFVVIVAAVAAAGAAFTPGPWYADLTKPDWTPPAGLFGPVWTALYATIAVAGWLAWRRRDSVESRRAQAAFAFFGLQLVLNALWSFFFFGLRRPDIAFADIVLLWLAILANVLLFYGLRPAAGLLLLPYFAWVSFAARLNLAIWRLNP
jgi:tryptophan-rich sensory protein